MRTGSSVIELVTKTGLIAFCEMVPIFLGIKFFYSTLLN